MGETWTDDETLFLICFASRGVQAEVLTKIIERKCNTFRSLPSVQNRIRYVRDRERKMGHPDIWHPATGWFPERVDRWVGIYGQNMPQATALITLGQEELTLIAEVCR